MAYDRCNKYSLLNSLGDDFLSDRVFKPYFNFHSRALKEFKRLVSWRLTSASLPLD